MGKLRPALHYGTSHRKAGCYHDSQLHQQQAVPCRLFLYPPAVQLGSHCLRTLKFSSVSERVVQRLETRRHGVPTRRFTQKSRPGNCCSQREVRRYDTSLRFFGGGTTSKASRTSCMYQSMDLQMFPFTAPIPVILGDAQFS